jgi:hypothetical protein
VSEFERSASRTKVIVDVRRSSGSRYFGLIDIPL